MSKILTFGVYDYFHLGHLRLFKQCKAYADYLIVAVQDGNYIKKFKPDAKVLYTTEERVEMLEALRIVDKRWATMKLVLPFMSVSNAFWICSSVLVSIALVASSKISTGGLATAALAMDSNCLCP